MVELCAIEMAGASVDVFVGVYEDPNDPDRIPKDKQVARSN